MPRDPKPDDFLPLSPQDFQLLLVLLEGDLHAYGITKAVEEQQLGRVPLEIGSLYRILARIEDWGLIARCDEESAPSGPPRKLYQITPLGRAVTLAETARLKEVLSVAEARLAGVLG